MFKIDSVKEFIEYLPLPSFVLQNGYIKLANTKLTSLICYSFEYLAKTPFEEIINIKDRSTVAKKIFCCQSDLDFAKPLEFGVVAGNCHELYVRCAFFPVKLDDRHLTLVGQLIDITEQKTMEWSLAANNLKYKEIVNSLQEVVFEADVNGNVVFANQRAYDFFGYPTDFPYEAINIMQVIVPEDLARAKKNIAMLLMGKDIGITEYTVRRTDGSNFPVIIHSVPLFVDGKPAGIRGVIVDISERKQAEEKMKFMSLHDSLTGLYNRAHFEQELQRLNSNGNIPLGLLVCDVDGLKLVNDTLGHETGDNLLLAATKVICEAVRKNDIVARIGGDEFAILLPCRNESEPDAVRKRIYDNVEKYNLSHPELLLSISVGYSFSEACPHPSALFKEADNNMYREKLHRKQSNRSSIVKTLLKALDERDFITQGHAERLKNLVRDVAIYIGMPDNKLHDISLFAQFHDIGKVGVPDKILFKSTHLNPHEAKKMREHSEIGYRIAMSAPDLVPIAKLILNHHEWWNGEGYPQGLAGHDIPLECRILAICDAYDAMTNDRPYRKALSPVKAIDEIKRNAGIQFDSTLVKNFLKILESKYPL